MNKFVIRRISFLIFAFFILIFSCIFTFKKIYIREKCKDLYFATEHLTTKGNVENSLLTIHNFELSFLDDEFAIVKISGLTYEKPHESITCNAYFQRRENSLWDLKELIPLT